MKRTDKKQYSDRQKNRIKKMQVDEGIFLFGAGKIGREYNKKLKETGLVKAFVDNNIEIQGSDFDETSVISFEEYMKIGHPGFLIICVSLKNQYAVEEQLKAAGMRANEDYLSFKEFNSGNYISDIYYYFCKTIYMPLVQISVTERCTLKCKKCAHACNLVGKDHKDLSFEEVKSSADELFRVVDHVEEFVLIGGEPLLYPDLGKCIDYIGEHYRNRIDIFSITTNGTLLPDQEVLENSRKWNVLFRISDYSENIPALNERYKQLKGILEKNGVNYSFSKHDVWIDYGFDTVDNGDDEKKLEKIFDSCATPCHEVRGKRFYQCVMARSVSENMKAGKVGSEDYFDLSSIVSDEDRADFFEYIQGCSDKGYLDMCRYCRGMNAELYPIKVAEQM